ncbi:ABC transporter substrate-binding protein [Sporosarcina sp. FSL K6-3457]|uniref:ABC transporter substrate-binding protein n=1 Tax=Sporosarcina sp. FSL K6-3457 TaxID=2978204 RepID=UPI0030F61A0F
MTYPTSENVSTHTFYMPVSLITLEEAIGSSFEVSAELSYIVIVWGGKGIVSLNEQQYVISQGSVLLWDAPQGGEWTCTPHVPLQGILIGYRILTTEGSKQGGLGSKDSLYHCSSEIIRLSGKLESAWKQPSKREPFRIQQLFIELLVRLYDEREGQSQPTSPWMEQVIHYIDAHFHEDLTREQMSELAQVSPEHFSRTFRMYTGQTFSAYLAMLRIRSAQQRLLYEMPKLESLAQEVGYKEGTYLSRKFKQLVGVSPTAYHQKQKRVVVLNNNHTACLLALGITPELGVYSAWMESINAVNPSQKLYESGINTSAIYEAIASTQPDVIIDYYNVNRSKELLPLAPVLGLPFMNISWKEQFRLIADVVERQQQVGEWLAYYDAQIWTFNQKLDEQLGKRGTAVVWEIGTSSAYSFHSSHGRGSQILYEDIGFRPPASLLEHGIEQWGYIEKEIEAIADYPADHIFITGIPSNPGTMKRMDSLFKSESWLKMAAVREKRVYIIDEPDLFYGYDPLSSQAQLYELMKVLISQK